MQDAHPVRGPGGLLLFAAVALALAAAAIGGARAEIRSDQGRGAIAARTPVAPAPLVAAPVLGFVEPVAGYAVTSAFGLRRLAFEPDVRAHLGVDIAAPEGAPVRATWDGVVAASGRSETYGLYVELDHGQGVRSFYAHLSALAPLDPGAAVRAGQPVGSVGSTGRSTGPHLHFEIRRDGRRFDPEPFLGETYSAIAAAPFATAADEADLKGALRRARGPAPQRSHGRVTVTLAG